ncbi:MAG TPA: hypothetical protein VGK10_09025 [Prolixibacteraceae bacterium]|jgi:hypothetical protein
MNFKYLIPLTFTVIFIFNGCNQSTEKKQANETAASPAPPKVEEAPIVPSKVEQSILVDSLSYRAKLTALANGDTTGLWPNHLQSVPLNGAILPFKRIVAFYGNLYSKKMGVLGEYPPKVVWEKLNAEVKAWENIDPSTPVQPAIHYIAAVAQGIPMKDGKYCKRMPDQQIDSALTIAKMGNAIVFLDLQVAHSNVQHEVPLLEKYLKMPNVHLGIDPEFSMKEGHIPGRKIGTMDADDINFCSEYLAKLVKDNHLSPKILIVHRFTQGMVRNYKNIVLRPEVQIVMNMDGWGEPVLKHSTYKLYIQKEPVQFTGFKLFYKNDLKKPPHRMLTPLDLMKLKPQPIYIQYQ